MKLNFIFLIFSSILLTFVTAYYGQFKDIPGDYCRETYVHGMGCCAGRKDNCSMPILGTLCYCDQFCNRTINPDCCPDYWSTCHKGPPPGPVYQKHKGYPNCKFRGENIADGGSTTFNCNKCNCSKSVLTCFTEPCLMSEMLLENVKKHNITLGWKASNYSFLWGKKLEEGLQMLTGTVAPDEKSLRIHPIRLHYDLSVLPTKFDATVKWPNMLGGVRDQGWCGSSWAFSTITVAQDRLSIASNGTEIVDWSIQNMVSCNKRGQKACDGGHVERAWNYLRKFGVVTEDCYPYVSGSDDQYEHCKVSRRSTLQSIECDRKQFPKDRTELYTTEPAYRISSDPNDIMYEVMTNGPVQALMRVYQDFAMYKNGIYTRSTSNPKLNTQFSIHSVRLMGWGEERDSYDNPVKYWLAANSWGTSWGEEGMFKIRRGTNESGIENFILAVRSRLSEEANIITRRKRFSRKRSHRRRH